jgi:hypothetical protein
MITSITELDRIRAECSKLVTKRSLMAAGAAVVPIPGVDIVADISIMTVPRQHLWPRFEVVI